MYTHTPGVRNAKSIPLNRGKLSAFPTPEGVGADTQTQKRYAMITISTLLRPVATVLSCQLRKI